jgi:hypothetical protein
MDASFRWHDGQEELTINPHPPIPPPMSTQTALPFRARTAGWWRWQLSAATASLRLDS